MIQRDSDGFCDATEMCQQKGKRFNDYLKRSAAGKYVSEVCSRLGKAQDELILMGTKYHDNGRHTWVHPAIALDLARWLGVENSVDANLWILDQMEGLRLSFLSQRREAEKMAELAWNRTRALMKDDHVSTIAQLQLRIFKRKEELRVWKPKYPEYKGFAINYANDVLDMLINEGDIKFPFEYLARIVSLYEKCAAGVEYIVTDEEHRRTWNNFKDGLRYYKDLANQEAALETR